MPCRSRRTRLVGRFRRRFDFGGHASSLLLLPLAREPRTVGPRARLRARGPRSARYRSPVRGVRPRRPAAVSAVTICGPVRSTRSTLPSGNAPVSRYFVRNTIGRYPCRYWAWSIANSMSPSRRSPRAPPATGRTSRTRSRRACPPRRAPRASARPRSGRASGSRRCPGCSADAPATVSVVPVGSSRSTAITSPSTPSPSKKPSQRSVERRVADLLVQADRVLDALLGEPLPRDQAGLELRLTRRARARRGRRTSSDPEFIVMTGIPASTAACDRRTERVGVREAHDEPVRLRGDRSVDQLRHLHHVERARAPGTRP